MFPNRKGHIVSLRGTQYGWEHIDGGLMQGYPGKDATQIVEETNAPGRIEPYATWGEGGAGRRVFPLIEPRHLGLLGYWDIM